MPVCKPLRPPFEKPQTTRRALLRIRALGALAFLVVVSGALLQAQGQCAATVDRVVNICSPVAGATVASPVQFSAAALDNEHPVTAMILYIDSVNSAKSTSASLSASVALADGNHNIVIRAWDSSGFYFSSSETITVGSSTTPAPAVSITANPMTISPGGTSTLSVTAQNA